MVQRRSLRHQSPYRHHRERVLSLKPLQIEDMITSYWPPALLYSWLLPDASLACHPRCPPSQYGTTRQTMSRTCNCRPKLKHSSRVHVPRHDIPSSMANWLNSLASVDGIDSTYPNVLSTYVTLQQRTTHKLRGEGIKFEVASIQSKMFIAFVSRTRNMFTGRQGPSLPTGAAAVSEH